MIDGAIRAGVPGSVRIAGEISNFTDRTHWYFAVKDAQSVLSCIMFGARTKSVGFELRNGQQVVITARAEFYKPQGRVTLNVERIEPVGVGALELKLKQTVEECRARGWLEADRKRPMPRFPRRVAVITSKTGAAKQDVINTAARRCPAVELCFIDTLVQGEGAAPLVAAAVRWVSARAADLGIDALIVTRGGGSIEDLWAFNEMEVAEAIVNCSVPVACAIGHETDTTVAELVADERCATPTQAAMRLTPDAAGLREQAEMVGARLAGAMRDRADRARQAGREQARHLLASVRQASAGAGRRLEQIAVRLERAKPAAILERRRARVMTLADRLSRAMRDRADWADLPGAAEDLERAMSARLQRASERLASLERLLDLVGPQAVLARGYSVTIRADGGVLRSAADAKPGEDITTRLADGSVQSTVKGEKGEALPAQQRLGVRRRRPPTPGDAGPGLFG